jgi:hypothetical protein
MIAPFLFLVLSLADGGNTVLVDGKPVEAAKLPEAVPKAVRDIAVRLEPWAEKFHLRIHVSENEPTLLAVPVTFANPTPMMTELKAAKDDYVQRASQKLPDTCFEVIYVEAKDALAAYVDDLAAREEYLKSWAPGAKGTAGFWLMRPYAAAYFRDLSNTKEVRSAEFNVRNQLVHQYAHLLANATLGRQPYWVQEGIAWSLEQARENTIYAFCHKSGFVFRKDHAGWPKLGRTYLSSSGTVPLDKVFAMDRTGDIPKDLGAGAMALIDGLLAKHRGEFLKCLAAFKADYEAKNGDPNYKIAVDTQKDIFLRVLGANAAKTLAGELKP